MICLRKDYLNHIVVILCITGLNLTVKQELGGDYNISRYMLRIAIYLKNILIFIGHIEA